MLFSKKAKNFLFGQDPSKKDKGKKRLTSLSTLLIILLVIFNSFFTYSGAYVILDEIIPSIFIAATIQVSIAITLIALPHVRKTGKVFVLFAYAISMLLSILFAFTYTHEKYTGNTDEAQNKIAFESEVSRYVSKVKLIKSRELDESKVKLDKLKRDMDEELSLGRKSGKGAGKGDVYYEKKDKYDEYLTVHNQIKEQVENIDSKVESINGSIKGSYTINNIVVDIKSLESNVKNKSMLSFNTESISAINMSDLDKSLSALNKIKDMDSDVLIGVLIAVIFDLIALLIGVIRSIVINTEEKKGNVFEKVLSLYKDVVLFKKRVKDLPEEIERERKQGSNTEVMDPNMKTKYFVISLLSCAYISNDGDDLSLLQEFKKTIKPIDTKKGSNVVGVYFDDVKDKDEINSLLAELLRYELVFSSPEDQAYILSTEINSFHLFNIINNLVIGEHKVTDIHTQIENYFKENAKNNYNNLLEFDNP